MRGASDAENLLCHSPAMRVIHSLEGLAEVPGPIFIAVGVFDGVHLGHQDVIRRCLGEAEADGGTAAVLTFDPHPARILRPESAPHLLTSTPHKLRLIEALGCRYLFLQAFDAAFAAQAPEAFVGAMAKNGSLRGICVGQDWAFGRNRAGNVNLLRSLGEKYGFRTLEIPPVKVDGEPVSSTRIRQAVEAGDFSTARRFLGRDYTILGTVREGRRLGRELGFPTANLAAHNEQFPPDGVYAVHILLRGTWHGGVANIGVRPTVSAAAERALEVHIFGFEGTCYGEDMEVRFEGFLRPEQKFQGLEPLKAQIQEDAKRAHALLGE